MGGRESRNAHHRILRWETIIKRSLFTFGHSEHDSENAYVRHYTDITLLCDVTLWDEKDEGEQRRRMLPRKNEDGKILSLSFITISFEPYQEIRVELNGWYGKADAPFQKESWFTNLAMWQQHAQQRTSTCSTRPGRLRVAFRAFQYSNKSVMEDLVHSVFTGPIKLLTDVRGFGEHFESNQLAADTTFNHAVRNKHSGEVFFYEQDEWAYQHVPAAIGFVLSNHVAPQRRLRRRNLKGDKCKDTPVWAGVVVRGCIHLRRHIQESCSLRKRVSSALQTLNRLHRQKRRRHHRYLFLQWLDGTQSSLPHLALTNAKEHVLNAYTHITHFYVLTVPAKYHNTLDNGRFSKLAQLLLLRSVNCHQVSYIGLDETFFEDKQLAKLAASCQCQAEPVFDRPRSHRHALTLQHVTPLAPCFQGTPESSDSDVDSK